MSHVPLSDDRLNEIRELVHDVEHARSQLTGLMGPRDRPRAPVLQALMDVLAEVDRQRAVLARGPVVHIHLDDLPVVQTAIAEAHEVIETQRVELELWQDIGREISAYGHDSGGECALCHHGILHTTACPVSRARAMLDDEATP